MPENTLVDQDDDITSKMSELQIPSGNQSQNTNTQDQDNTNKLDELATSFENSLNLDKDVLNNNKLPKRKRVRKRKRNKNKYRKLDSPEATTPEVCQQKNLTPESSSAKTSPVHIRFTDDEMDTNHTDAAQDKQRQVNADGGNLTNSKDDQVVTEVKEPDYFNEDFISKHPLTPDMKPKVGDLIAFKTLRISEDYCPVVSSSIVGKVVSFCEGTDGEVSFNVLYGRDQCVEPRGKFSLKQDLELVNGTKKEQGSSIFNFVWNNVYEPRLIIS